MLEALLAETPLELRIEVVQDLAVHELPITVLQVESVWSESCGRKKAGKSYKSAEGILVTLALVLRRLLRSFTGFTTHAMHHQCRLRGREEGKNAPLSTSGSRKLRDQH